MSWGHTEVIDYLKSLSARSGDDNGKLISLHKLVIKINTFLIHFFLFITGESSISRASISDKNEQSSNTTNSTKGTFYVDNRQYRQYIYIIYRNYQT